MKVVILCGGLGTRMREETEFRPKPMVEIGGKPILWHIMKLYAHHGLTEFVLCLGYRGEIIKEYFLNYQAVNDDFTIRLGDVNAITFHGNHLESGWSVTLADTGALAQTGARLKRVERYLGEDDDFCLTYGDGVGDVDLARLVAYHRSHGRIATVTGVRSGSSRFGELVIDDDRVTRFSEKPLVHDTWINGGFFVFNRRFLRYLRDEDDCVLEREPLERVAADGELRVYRHEGYWQCMDTYRDIQLLERRWKEGRAPWAVWNA